MISLPSTITSNPSACSSDLTFKVRSPIYPFLSIFTTTSIQVAMQGLPVRIFASVPYDLCHSGHRLLFKNANQIRLRSWSRSSKGSSYTQNPVQTFCSDLMPQHPAPATSSLQDFCSPRVFALAVDSVQGPFPQISAWMEAF